MGIRKIVKVGLCILRSNSTELSCSLSHMVETPSGFKEAASLVPGDTIITATGPEKLTAVDILSDKETELFDLVEVEGHAYLTNDISSHNCDFIGSGDNLIDGDTMRELERHVRPPIKTMNFGVNNTTWIWEDPIDGEDYLISADVARGDGEDYSAAVVIKRSTNEQVAEFKDKVPPDMYAGILVKLGNMYNKALLAPEANSIGYATCLKIVEHRYPNIFYSMPSHFNPRNRKWMERNLTDEDKMVPGFQTTAANKPLIITSLEESLRTGRVLIRSQRLVNELKTFIWKNGKAQAQDGFNDDLCMALGIGQLILNTMLIDIENAKKRTIAMLESFEAVQSMQPVNNKLRNGEQDPYVFRLPDGSEENLRGWLIDIPHRG